MSRVSRALALAAAVVASIATSTTEPAYTADADVSGTAAFDAPDVHSVDLVATLPASSWGDTVRVTVDVLETDAVVSGHLYVDDTLVASDDTGLPSGQQTFVFDATDALVVACHDSGQTQGTCALDLRLDIDASGTGFVDAYWSVRVEVSDDVAVPAVTLD
jgi:hypothetical protein